MNTFPSKAEFKKLSSQGNMIPVYTDLMADFETPVSVYAKLSHKRPAFLFESITGGEHINRYSFIGCQPRKIITSYESETHIDVRGGVRVTMPTPDDPLVILEEHMEDYNPVELPNMPRFVGGAVGFLGYEYVHRIEKTVSRAEEDTLGMPIMYFMITDTVIIFDHVRQLIRICSNAHITGDPEGAYDNAVTEIESIFKLLSEGSKLAPCPLADDFELDAPKGNFTKEEFEDVVKVSKEYIRNGDIIQTVCSQRFEAPYDKPPIDLYRTLRVVNPSPYMFIMETEDFSTVGASPEVHVRVTDDLVELRPIAGTRPRGKDTKQDLYFEKDLLSDEKERAEHLMLVDLARNDIGRVCLPGKIEVPEYMIIERYSHVMHIVSQVQGLIDPDKSAYDVMRATFPAGTVSGAPKVRAMQIISEQEKSCRGLYAGALGYFGYNGNLDSCIVIRTALLKDGKIYVQSGAGLVADSIPENEFEETMSKARAMLKAVAFSREI